MGAVSGSSKNANVYVEHHGHTVSVNGFQANALLSPETVMKAKADDDAVNGLNKLEVMNGDSVQESNANGKRIFIFFSSCLIFCLENGLKIDLANGDRRLANDVVEKHKNFLTPSAFPPSVPANLIGRIPGLNSPKVASGEKKESSAQIMNGVNLDFHSTTVDQLAQYGSMYS